MHKILSSENLNIHSSSLIIEELVRFGVTYFCVSPGSRSAPLTIAVSRNSKAIMKIIYDERGAAFHALGYSRATQKPAVLICTSGTAVANYYPAVIEASQEFIPLIILSADRPAELRNSGANQTINQVKLFGKYSRFFYDLPCPENINQPSYILKIMDEAYYKATHKTKSGPVHINCTFREPLWPEIQNKPENYITQIKPWLQSNKVFSFPTGNSVSEIDKDSAYLTKFINKNNFGIILCGRLDKNCGQKEIIHLAEKLNWPVFPDITSGLRFSKSSQNIIQHYDQLLLSEKIILSLIGIPVLHFGSQFVSKRLLRILETNKAKHIHIHYTVKVVDPVKSVSKRIIHPIPELIKGILGNLTQKPVQRITKNLISLNSSLFKIIRDYSDNPSVTVNEISVAGLISKYITNKSALFLASSMPVRDMDMYGVAAEREVIVSANRGASGIDGTIASAYGFACGHQKALTLVIGDLAFIHDLSSLAMLQNLQFPFIIILLNNKGGGIFSFLPIADYKEVFEKNFATPHNFSFKNSAKQFDLNYYNPKTNRDFLRVYKKSQTQKAAALIEINSNRFQNLRNHKSLQKEIMSVLSAKKL
jgi:2-succinyl-5-enolpyruvyl-6-hydroxy-3-cyclohexene-1-carboxylate synthase